jgi:hypothetical protein
MLMLDGEHIRITRGPYAVVVKAISRLFSMPDGGIKPPLHPFHQLAGFFIVSRNSAA